jgi:hypothetical protein
MSLISFIQKLFSIGLAPTMNLVVTFYRKMFYPAFYLISYACSFRIPDWYRDLFVLSALFSVALYRSYTVSA